MWEIWYQYPGQEAEVIDTATDKAECDFLFGEWSMAMGGVGRLWTEKVKDDTN